MDGVNKVRFDGLGWSWKAGKWGGWLELSRDYKKFIMEENVRLAVLNAPKVLGLQAVPMPVRKSSRHTDSNDFDENFDIQIEEKPCSGRINHEKVGFKYKNIINDSTPNSEDRTYHMTYYYEGHNRILDSDISTGDIKLEISSLKNSPRRPDDMREIKDWKYLNTSGLKYQENTKMQSSERDSSDRNDGNSPGLKLAEPGIEVPMWSPRTRQKLETIYEDQLEKSDNEGHQPAVLDEESYDFDMSLELEAQRFEKL